MAPEKKHASGKSVLLIFKYFKQQMLESDIDVNKHIYAYREKYDNFNIFLYILFDVKVYLRFQTIFFHVSVRSAPKLICAADIYILLGICVKNFSNIACAESACIVAGMSEGCIW